MEIIRNTDTRFKGLYTLSTQLLNPRKTAGDPYDFREQETFK
jgi:hypothetical protein